MLKTLFLGFFLLSLSSSQLNGEEQRIKTDYIRVEARVMTLDNDLYLIKTDLKVFNDEDGMEMKAQSGIFDTQTEILKASGKVQMKRGDSRLSCGQMVYYSREGRALMRENPTLIQERDYGPTQTESGEKRGDKIKNATGLEPSAKTKIVVLADEIEFFQNEDRILAKGDVRIIEAPSFVEDEELLRPDVAFINKINCESLELFILEDKSINRGNVKIITPHFLAYGDKAIYHHSEKKVEISGHAKTIQTENYKILDEQHKNTIEGDRIVYFLNEQRTLVVGKVSAVVYQYDESSPSTSPASPLK